MHPPADEAPSNTTNGVGPTDARNGRGSSGSYGVRISAHAAEREADRTAPPERPYLYHDQALPSDGTRDPEAATRADVGEERADTSFYFDSPSTGGGERALDNRAVLGSDRAEQQSVEPSPRPDRFERLREAERTDGRLWRNPLATAFDKIPVPPPNATFEQLNDYRRRANRAGVHITANDLEAYAGLDEQSAYTGATGTLDVGQRPDAMKRLISDEQSRAHVARMVSALAKQRPDLVTQLRDAQQFAARNQLDALEARFPGKRVADYIDVPDKASSARFAADLDVRRITADPKAFETNFRRLQAMPPMGTRPSFAEFETYRSSMRSVGAHLTRADLDLYRTMSERLGQKETVRVLTEEATVPRALGWGDRQPIPASLKILGELHQAPEHRFLLSPQMEMRYFVEEMRERQPITAAVSTDRGTAPRQAREDETEVPLSTARVDARREARRAQRPPAPSRDATGVNDDRPQAQTVRANHGTIPVERRTSARADAGEIPPDLRTSATGVLAAPQNPFSRSRRTESSGLLRSGDDATSDPRGFGESADNAEQRARGHEHARALSRSEARNQRNFGTTRNGLER